VGPNSQLPNTLLSRLSGRSVTWRLQGNSEAQFTINLELEESAAIQELISDLWVFFNGQALYRGRIGPASDTFGPDTATSTYSSADTRALLARRLIFDSDQRVYATQDVSNIAWALIAQTQGKTGGNLRIIRGQGQTAGKTQNAQYQAGSTVSDMLVQLATAGFEFDINPAAGSVNQTFDVYVPQRGLDRQVILDYPGRVNSGTRTVDTSAYANALRVTGDTGLAAVKAESSSIAGDATGRFDAQYGDTNVATLSALNSTATSQLAKAQLVQPAYQVTLQANTWAGPQDFWLGDPITLKLQYGNRMVNESLRVFEIALTLDDDSDASIVQVTLGAPNPDRRWRLHTLDQRITQLEKR
jgi:hypothetical protein